MGALTEVEIFDRLHDSFGRAADCCERLAKLPAKGPTYVVLREQLKLLEGACRQAGFWRGDSRWFNIGRRMEEVHQKAGDFLRQHRPQICFLQLAQFLRQLAWITDKTRHAATGRRGDILPTPKPVHRDTRPVHVHTPRETTTPGGIIVPQGVALQ